MWGREWKETGPSNQALHKAESLVYLEYEEKVFYLQKPYCLNSKDYGL